MAHILVVDDDGDLRALLKTALERDGHQVSLLDRGGAVSEAHCRWADCILLDVMMPGEDGFATCRRIRALAACPILFLTAKTEEADVLTGLGLGGDDYLSSPSASRSCGPGWPLTCGGSPGRPAAASAGAGWTSIWRSGPSTAGRKRCT